MEFAEWKRLWEHLGAGHAEEKATAAEAADPLYATFKKYDINNQGYLSQVAALEPSARFCGSCFQWSKIWIPKIGQH